METNVKEVPLTLADRCDRCGAQAWVRATLTDSTLLFCAHHGHKHIDALKNQSLLVEDFSEWL